MTKKSILLNIAIASLLKISFAQDTIQLRNSTIAVGFVKEINAHEVKFIKIENPEGPLYILNKYEVAKVKYQNGSVDKFEYVAPWRRKNLPSLSLTLPNDSALIQYAKQELAQSILSSKPGNAIGLEKNSYHEKRNYFSLNQTILKGSKLNNFLLAENNPVINLNVNKAKSYRTQSYLGFLAIPTALVGAFYLLNDSKSYRSSEGIKLDRQTGLACILASAVTVGYTIRVNNLRTEHLQKAVDAYNENRTEGRLVPGIYIPNKNRNNTLSKDKITILRANQYLYNDEVKNEYQIQEIMLKKHDPVIQQKIEASKKGRLLRHIIFADIPLTIAGFGILVDALERDMRGEKLSQKKVLSSAFLVAGAACFTIGIYNAAAYKRNTKKAALRYNKLYNN
jgi:hypothetical protein